MLLENTAGYANRISLWTPRNETSTIPNQAFSAARSLKDGIKPKFISSIRTSNPQFWVGPINVFNPKAYPLESKAAEQNYHLKEQKRKLLLENIELVDCSVKKHLQQRQQAKEARCRRIASILSGAVRKQDEVEQSPRKDSDLHCNRTKNISLNQETTATSPNIYNYLCTKDAVGKRISIPRFKKMFGTVSTQKNSRNEESNDLDKSKSNRPSILIKSPRTTPNETPLQGGTVGSKHDRRVRFSKVLLKFVYHHPH